ncbi:MAG: integrin alpha [Candidatus Midichloria sp.]|nr:integrin alpha [Candidatus Midichloria sp.]
MGGQGDLIISAPYASPERKSQVGQVYVIFGKSSFSKTLELSGLTAQMALLSGIAKDDYAGTVIAAFDINGDGLNDVVIGAYKADTW